MRHPSIPQAGPFQCFEWAPLVGFHADEPCAGIHVFQEVKWIALIIPDSADHIHRIKMRAGRKQFLLSFRIRIHLGLLYNLPGRGVLGVCHPKWPSAWVAGIGNYSTDPDGAI